MGVLHRSGIIGFVNQSENRTLTRFRLGEVWIQYQGYSRGRPVSVTLETSARHAEISSRIFEQPSVQ